MADSQSFSDGVDNLLQTVRPHGRAASAFPPELDETQARRSPGENLHDWFVRMVDQVCDGEPKRIAIEHNIAVLLKLAWKD
jgi:hypothetical protein